MRFSEPIWIVGIITATLVIFILIMMWIIYRRRTRLIKMGWLVNGTVLEIVERRGFKGNKYSMSVIEYHHHLAGKTTVEMFSAKKTRTNKKGNVMPLYYHPGKPTLVALQNDNHTRVAMIVLTVLATFVLTSGIICIRLLLFETYRS
jgi:Protein of unknown function (DUF3592)